MPREPGKWGFFVLPVPREIAFFWINAEFFWVMDLLKPPLGLKAESYRLYKQIGVKSRSDPFYDKGAQDIPCSIEQDRMIKSRCGSIFGGLVNGQETDL